MTRLSLPSRIPWFYPSPGANRWVLRFELVRLSIPDLALLQARKPDATCRGNIQEVPRRVKPPP